MTDKQHSARRASLAGAGALLTIAVFSLATPASAQLGPADRGYIGPSYLDIPDLKGAAKDPDHKGWVRAEAHYWKVDAPVRRPAATAPASPAAAIGARPAAAQAQTGQQGGGGGGMRRPAYTLPAAPRQGPGTFVLSIDKKNPSLAALMQRCTNHTVMPEATYSVTTNRGRNYQEIGDLPAGVPDWISFKMKDVKFVDCPVVDKAPEQALVVQFGDISWDWQPPATPLPQQFHPAVLKPLPPLTGITKSWLVTWIAVAHDVSDDQCPVMADKPTEDDYYALMSKEDAAKERAALASQGGPNYQNGEMDRRGPHKLSVVLLPGIVPDPGMPMPQTKIARGLNLDGDDGTIDKHKNYVSADGKVTGIDNQLYTAKGCVSGWQGHKGFITQFANNQMRDGQFSLLLEVSGIDNMQNDNEVWLTIHYSNEPMAKSASGAQVLADYSFPLSSNPEWSQFDSRIRAKIVDGVLITEPVDKLKFSLGIYGTPPQVDLSDARIRLELKPDGTLKGVLGGYIDWRKNASGTEFYFGFQAPALYNAMKRLADGMKDPVTGEYNGISTAYDIEGIPAFITPANPPRIAQNNKGSAGP